MGYRTLALFLCFVLLHTAAPFPHAFLFGAPTPRGGEIKDVEKGPHADPSHTSTREAPQASPTASSTPTLDRHSEEIRAKVLQLGTSTRITVKMKSRQEYYGTVTRVKPDFFEMEEIDQKRILTIKYSDVQKVHEWYGAKNAFAGRRTRPHGRLIGFLVIGGLLITLIAIAATQRD